MSASATQIAREAPLRAAESGYPLREGNRVIESVAQREALRALLAFSALHEQIRRRRAYETAADEDLFHTERFVLGEVLQLICDRAQSITGAEGVLIALFEGNEIRCHAVSGILLLDRRVPLVAESAFLREGVSSGRIQRCDDCLADPRTELDLCRLAGARSTVLIPLRGQGSAVGVLQAFARGTYSFSDHDVRCFDLFGELVLSALRPEDQDRRLNWLTDVAGQILTPEAASMESEWAEPEAIAIASRPVIAEPEPTEVLAEPPAIIREPEAAAPGFAATPFELEATDSEPLAVAPESVASKTAPGTSDGEVSIAAELVVAQSPDIASIDSEPERRELVFSLPPVDELVAQAEVQSASDPTPPFVSVPSFALQQTRSSWLRTALVLIAAGGLFAAGGWWSFRTREKAMIKTAPAPTPTVENTFTPATTKSVPVSQSDHLLDPVKLDSPAPLPPPASESSLATFPKVTGVRHWSSALGSTVAIDMEDQVPYEVHRLSSPERIYFDLHDTALLPELAARAIDVGDSSLMRVRVAQPVAGVTRVVLDTKAGTDFSVSMESNPYRLIVQLRGSDRAPAVLRADGTPRVTAPAREATLSPAPLRPQDDRPRVKPAAFRIVLDAGHGGWDLGTVGRQGLLEKDLVLDVTERLGRLLRNRLGAEVIYTRSTDTYLPLDQRAEVANHSQANLFVSVHANYSSAASARGVETYYTNFFSPPESREAEARENETSLKPVAVSLSAAELREKVQESRQLAANVQRSLYTTLATKSPGIRNRGVKDSAFVVLMGTTMPAILTEISFVSSPTDERNLLNAGHREQIAEALYKGIAQYEAGTARKVKVAQVRPVSAQRASAN